ncbi:guanine nucleotide-binding protein-like 1 [Planoprotostelium fungivorum]|uniref:Guanine nucleotide-binding protein-like 1 n=1 Tax=Planoprotostelium fungivorum TaxID=1890364 RepID=A0A2P6NPL6_9EUKA|nr:guanine nucleotide-binding protein-like 1 [Planoprotostelium fungivorum]
MTRSKPFSAKQKKQQLKDKRENKRTNQERERQEEVSSELILDDETVDVQSHENPETKVITDQNGKDDLGDVMLRAVSELEHLPKGGRKRDLRTVFEREDRGEIERRKTDAQRPLDMEKREKPWSILNEYLTDVTIAIPKRPEWNFSLNASELEDREMKAFKEWLAKIYDEYPHDRLNYFEHNIEVWRQLWRVTEKSDVIVLVTDARFPLFHFPPALYDYITVDMGKPMVLVMNKQDLVEAKVVEAWKKYFEENFPDMHVVAFNSFSIIDMSKTLDMNQKRKMRRQRRYETSSGMESLFGAINALDVKKAGKKIVLAPPEKKYKGEEAVESDDEETDDDDDGEDEQKEEKDHEAGADQVVLGMLGHPNVGKSSLINGLMGKKVVSTSRTPGHTKHFQTIHLTPHVILCDCPGLVFPALDRPKALQILCGLYPIAQVREPFSAIRYLSERVSIEKIYSLKYPDEDDMPGDERLWSPYKICEAYGYKKGYLIARTGRSDVHRAGLELLKDCVDGKIPISWPPPGYQEEIKEDEMSHETEEHVEDEDSQDENERQPVKNRKQKKKDKRRQQLQSMLDDDDEDEDEQLSEALRIISVAKKESKVTETKAQRKKSEKAKEWSDRLEAKQSRSTR